MLSRIAFGRFVADRRGETDEHPPIAVHRTAGPKRIAEKVEPLLRVALAPVGILAVDDLGLLRVQFADCTPQTAASSASRSARAWASLATVADHVVSVAFERDVGMVLAHPAIERIVKKEISQDGADNSRLEGSLSSRLTRVPSGMLTGALQPSFDVQQHPWAVGVSPHRSHQQIPVDVIEETLDVEVEHPVMAPASLPRYGQGVMR